MKNQSSNSSVDKEINSQSSKPSQQSQGQSLLLREQLELRNKSNSSSQNSTFRRVPSAGSKNEKVQRPQSVTQRPSSIPKFGSSNSNEAAKLGSNVNTRSQDDSYAVNSLINSMNNSYCIVSNTSDQSNKPKQLNSHHQRGSSMQAIGQVNNNVQQNNVGKGGSSLSLSNQIAQTPQSILSGLTAMNHQLQGVTGEDKLISNISHSFSAAQSVTESGIGFPGVGTSQIFSTGSNYSALLTPDIAVIKHASSVDLPSNSSQSISSKFNSQQFNSLHKYPSVKQNQQQIVKPLKFKQKELDGNEEDQDDDFKEEEDEEQIEQNENILQQNQLIDGWNRVIINKVDFDIQAANYNQGISILGVNSELEKIDLNNSSSSKHTSNSATSRSNKNQSNVSDDALQDLKQESANNNSILVSSSNNSSKVFKGSSNNSIILNSCSTKVASANPEMGNLNDFIQSKEEINKSIRSKCCAKPRESHILQNSRHPIKPIQPDESKNQIISLEERQGAAVTVSMQAKPNPEMSESQLKQKPKNLKQLIQRRGNTLSRSDVDDLKLGKKNQAINEKKTPSEDERINPIVSLENKTMSEGLASNLNTNPLSFINQGQSYDFQTKINEEDNQTDQDYQQDDQEEDIEIKKQVEILNSDDSENEDKKRVINGNSGTHPPGVYSQSIYQPVPINQSQYSHLNFLDIQNQNTPQIQQQTFDPFQIPQSASTPTQQMEFINAKRAIGPRPMSIDQHYSFFASQSQQQAMNIPDKCGSPYQFQDFSQQQSQQNQSPYGMYESPAHQHMQPLFNQGIKQPSPSMNNMIQFNQIQSSPPPAQTQQQQQNYQMFSQHPQMQQMICQFPHPPQHTVAIQQGQQGQQASQQQQQGQIFNQNQLNIGQQGQQQIFSLGKNQRQHLQIQSNSLFSSNSSSTYHLPKQNCNLSQASTTESELINTFRSGSSYGMQDIQQDLVVKMIQQKSQQLQQQLQSQNLRAQQVSFMQPQQSQIQQQQQQQSTQINQQLNFYPHHRHPSQQDNKFFQQPNTSTPQFLLEPYASQPQYNYSSLDQLQQNQQIPFTQEYMQATPNLFYLQIYTPQNPQGVPQQISQMSPDKFGQVPPPHMFTNPQVLINSDANINKTQFFGQQQQVSSYNKPSHQKQLSCQNFGQGDMQNQMYKQNQKQQQQNNNNNHWQKNNGKNNAQDCGSNQKGNNVNNNSIIINNNSNNSSQNNISNSNASQQNTGKKKFEIKQDDPRYDINLDKLGEDERTTVYIKNIPNKYKLKCVLQTIEKNHKDTFDFFYLPIDFHNKCNVGYAFINFKKPEFIREFYLEFNGKKWKKFNSDKICNLKYAAIQGKDQLYQHFEKSTVMNQSEEQFKPLFIKDSEQGLNESQSNSMNCMNQSNQQIHNSNNSINNQSVNINASNIINSKFYNNSQQQSNINQNNKNYGGQKSTNNHRKNNSNSNNNYSNRHFNNSNNNSTTTNSNNNSNNNNNNSNTKSYNSKHEYVQKQ